VRYAIFFVVLIAVDLLLHWFLWTRLVRDPGWSARAQLAGTIVTIVFAVATPLGMVLARSLPRTIAQPIASAIFVWMGVAFVLFSITLFFQVLKVALAGAVALYAKIGSGGEAPDPVRRQLLARGAAIATGVIAAGAAARGLANGLGEVEVREVEVKLARLPPALAGMTIVQLSDVHVGPLIGSRFIEQLVARVNALKPDAIVITGDLVDGSVAELGQHVAPLSKLSARWGRYFVTGNHEYYSGVDEWLPELSRHGLRVLRNERVTLGDAASIDLAGIDDAHADRFGGDHGADLVKAVRERDLERELVLLAHQPLAIDDAAKVGVGLQLSGHTHGGQIWPFEHIVKLVQPYVAGLHTHGETTTQIYVSRGTGFWGPPMRIGAPAEISKIILV